jgi:hypothetical protein
MSNWSRTFRADEVNLDGRRSCANVWTAIHDEPTVRALGKVEIHVDSDHGQSVAAIYMTPKEMHEFAFNLNVHANRLEELEAEAALLVREAA